MIQTMVPLMNASVTGETREIYLAQLRDCGVSQILLTTAHCICEPAEEDQIIASLRENIAFFRENGISAGVWIGSTIGHGSKLAIPGEAPTDSFSPLVNLEGQPIAGTSCPLDAAFRGAVCRHIARVAGETGTDLIQLDDDFRLSQHGKSPCCCCARHLARMEAICGEPLAGKDLKRLIFAEKANRYRAAWLRAQGDSLRNFAAEIREAVDAVAPHVRIGICSAQSLWEQDGTSATEIAAILAGETKPTARLYGAPYWAVHAGKSLPWVFENARNVASFCRGAETELWAEGDVYPRPRCFTPASYLELYDAMVRADGQYQKILKYMVDYSAPPEYETGYLMRHKRDLPDLEAVSACFAGTEAVGVRVVTRTGLLAGADLSVSGLTNEYDSPTAGILLAQNSIPTGYGSGGTCSAVFGENARGLSADSLQCGAMLDGVSARILTEQGVDVGLLHGTDFLSCMADRMSDGGDRTQIAFRAEQIRILDGKLDPRAEELLWTDGNADQKPLAYRYTNRDGQRFLVWMYDALSLQIRSALTCGRLIQQALVDGLEWIAQTRLPAVCKGNPELYLLVKQNSGKRVILLLNCFADEVDSAEIRLDRPYACITQTLRCRAELQKDRLRITTPIPAFSFAAVELRK